MIEMHFKNKIQNDMESSSVAVHTHMVSKCNGIVLIKRNW